MRKTIQINIGGGQFHIDDDAYTQLRQYLDALKTHFEKDAESAKEIIADIEQRIAELFRSKITEGKQAITGEDVNEVIKTLGSIEDFQYAEEITDDPGTQDRRANRRFYRDSVNNYLGGVAAGLGAYFNIDPLWIRIAFIVLLFFKGIGLLIYAVLWLVVPKAITTAQKLEMKGKPVTISTIEKSIAGEYQNVKSNFSSWTQSEKTRSNFHEMISALTRIFLFVFKVFFYAVGIVFLIIGSFFLAAILMLFFGSVDVFNSHGLFSGWLLPDLTEWVSNPANLKLFAISLFVLILIPFVSLLYAGIKIVFHIQTKSVILRATALTAWILALILFFTVLISELSHASIETMGSDSHNVAVQSNSTLYIDLNDNINEEQTISYSVFGFTLLHNKRRDEIYGKASITIIPVSDQKEVSYSIKRYLRNVSIYDVHDDLDKVDYTIQTEDSGLVLDKYFKMDEEDFWRFGKVVVEIKVPVGTRVHFDREICNLLNSEQHKQYCVDHDFAGTFCIMTKDGLVAPDTFKNTR